MCYAAALQPITHASGGGKSTGAANFNARDVAMYAAHSALSDAQAQWRAQQPADDSNGQAWKDWQAAKPLGSAYIKPAAIATRSAPGRGGSAVSPR